MIDKKIILITLALIIAVIPSVSAATFFDYLMEEPSVIEDPLLCVAIDMWGCEIPPENAIYGELYTHDIFTVQVPSVDPWINVTGINQTGNFSILEQGVLDPWTIKITRNGTYMADYSVSFQAPGGASDYHFGISLNGADPENKTHSHRANTAGGDWGVSSLSAIMQLNDGDKIFLQVSDTDAPARDIEIQSANFNAHELQTFQTSQTIIVNQTTSGISGNITGVWVNKTGDTMSGDLNISAAAAITNTLRVGGHSAFGTTGALFAIRVLDAAEDINIDSSYNGIVSVLRQMVNNSGGREVLAFNYEVVCDNNITCGGNMAGYRGNSRNRGWAEIMRGGYVTVFNERADHNITSAVGLFSVIATRLNNIRGMITTADSVRAHFTVENGTIGNATGFRIIDTTDKTASTQGDIWNMWGIKIDDLMSDRYDASWTFDFGDSINWSRIRGNYTGHQLLNQTFLMVPEWFKVVPTLYVYKNGTINVDANYSVSSGDVVIWSNGTVESKGDGFEADDSTNRSIIGQYAFPLTNPNSSAIMEGILTSTDVGFVAHRSGSLTGLSVTADVVIPLDLGECWFEVYINASKTNLLIKVVTTGRTKTSVTQRVGLDNFVADDIIWVQLLDPDGEGGERPCVQAQDTLAFVEAYFP